jgi:hypothetical protein
MKAGIITALLFSCTARFSTDKSDDQPPWESQSHLPTRAEFAEALDTDFICTVMRHCNPDFDCSIFDDLEQSDTAGCRFDAEMARECMDGQWTCEGEGEYAYAVAPEACSEVYDCEDDDDTDDGDDDDDDDAAE